MTHLNEASNSEYTISIQWRCVSAVINQDLFYTQFCSKTEQNSYLDFPNRGRKKIIISTVIVLISFPAAMIKQPDRSNLGRKDLSCFTVTCYSPSTQRSHGSKHMRELTTSHPSSEKERKVGMHACQGSASSLLLIRTGPKPRNSETTQGGSPYLNPVKKTPHRQVHRPN